MKSTALSRNGDRAALLIGERAEVRRLPANGADPRSQAPTLLPPSPNGDGPHHDDRPALALFCYADPASAVGRYVRQIVPALARRQTPVHLFSRQDFGLAGPGVFTYPVGECASEDLLASAQEFARQACNAFVARFPVSCPHVTVLGCEWSSGAALSILRGVQGAGTVLSLHSLERQRSDMSSEVSRRIEEVELSELRAARAVLVHEAATAEVAKFWVPECGDRITCAHQPFPVEQFEGQLDPGEVKARYQVGPVDPTILYLGDLNERYGPDVLLKAMPAVLKNHKQARLIVVGEGDLYWPLRVYARYLLLEHAVRLVGSVEGQPLRELIQAADIVAVPSREATPWWPILTAWAAHRPVVATHTAAPGLLEHEKDSVLVYPNEGSCVWGVERLLFDPELGRTIARRGREKLEERFGWAGMAAQVEGLMGASAAR